LPADATPSFLWLPDLAAPGAELALGDEDAHYAVRVCRARSGDALRATDGRGTLAVLRLLTVRDPVRVRVESSSEAPDRGHFTVGCGAPEGTRDDLLVEKLAELGVRVLQPIDTERGAWERFAARRERLARVATAALRQSCQGWILEIREPRSLAEWLATLPLGGERWLADPSGADASGVGAAARGLAIVGPAGGLSGGEREAARGAGFQAVRLGGSRLRAETAAIALAAHWAARRAIVETSS
jgi:16S rRNA (uracil1498-N3)-methyltransferase